MKTIGILLIVIGAVMLAYQGLTYTRNETVLDIGPVKVESQEKKTVPLPPVLGGVTLISGVTLLVLGVRGHTGQN